MRAGAESTMSTGGERQSESHPLVWVGEEVMQFRWDGDRDFRTSVRPSSFMEMDQLL